jgi:hypothetical protein
MSINAVELRPRSVGEVLGLSLDLYRKNFPLFIGITAVVMVPVLLISSVSQLLPLLQVAMSPASLNNSEEAFTGTFLALSFATWCLSGIALLLGVLWPWMEGALTFNVIERILGRAPGLGQSYRETRPRWGSLWGSNILAQFGINAPWIVVYILFLFALILAAAASSTNQDAGGAIFAGVLTVLCVPIVIIGIVITIVLAINWTFRAPAIVGEGVDGVAALGRSTALAKGDRWRILGRYLLLAVIEFLLVGLPVLLVGTLVALITVPNIDTAANIDRAILPGFTMLSVIGIAVSFFGALLLTPLRIIYTAVNYIDLRTRKENLAQVLAGLSPVPAPSMPAVVAPAPAAAAAALVIATAPPPPAATMPVVPPPAPAEKIGIGIPANVDMNTLSPGQRIGVLFNRIRNEGASAHLLNELGMAYMDIGDQGGAMDAFNRARELDPNDADVVYNLMLLALQRKDMNSAKQMMRDYLRLETNAGDVDRVRNDPRFWDVLPE